MLILNAEEVRSRLGWGPLIEALREMFISGCEMPPRQHHQVDIPGADPATMLIMPAWSSGHYIGVKIVNIVPGNSSRNLPGVMGGYLLMDGQTSEVLAYMDASELTNRRTVAASALAASLLSRQNSEKLLVVGTGRLASNIALAHAAVRPIREVRVWGRSEVKARLVADQYSQLGLTASVCTDLQSDAAWADMISCATMSERPLVFGSWLTPGTHVDLMGAYRPDMRESDDELIRQSSLFVDNRPGALTEAGDLVQPMRAGAISEDHILADLAQLCKDPSRGRSDDDQITVFKSVGLALEDLAAAIVCYRSESA